MRLIHLVGLVAFTFVSSISVATPLISAKEAALPNAKNVLATRGISRGPIIKLNAPASETVESPFDFRMTFEPRGDAKIDPDSVKVIYLKFPFVDLTPRVKSAISTSGIDFPKAEVPPGNHSIRVTVKDTEGRETNAVFNIEVVK
mgnify:FL=1